MILQSQHQGSQPTLKEAARMDMLVFQICKLLINFYLFFFFLVFLPHVAISNPLLFSIASFVSVFYICSHLIYSALNALVMEE